MTPGKRSYPLMLAEAINISSRMQDAQVLPENIPLLCFCDRDDRGADPIPFIDPCKMETVGDLRKYRFPNMIPAIDKTVLKAWRERVKEYIGVRGKVEGKYELCFNRREYLK